MNRLTGRILHLQRLSTEDGPGIRTTVFFKGCPLQCGWCHNPESISSAPQIQWLETRCIACNTCQEVCTRGSLHRLDGRSLTIDRNLCDLCGDCVEACPGNALDLLGRTVEVEELVKEVLKDRSFYEASGGGVTASGGEPGLQPEFVAEFLRRVKEEGVSTALDTCGLISRSGLEKIMAHVDLILFDLKEADSKKHREFTRQGNEQIKESLLFIKAQMPVYPQLRLWVRTPLIPGATATRENVRGIGNFLAQNLDGQLERWELCSFNNLCRDKYRRLGMKWAYEDTPLLSQEAMDELFSAAKTTGVRAEQIHISGATQSK